MNRKSLRAYRLQPLRGGRYRMPPVITHSTERGEHRLCWESCGYHRATPPDKGWSDEYECRVQNAVILKITAPFPASYAPPAFCVVGTPCELELPEVTCRTGFCVVTPAPPGATPQEHY